MNEEIAKKKTRFFGLSRNVIVLSVVSFLNDLSSEMIFPFIPIFLTSVLGASVAFVGLVEGIADGASSILKVISGRYSDIVQKRKPFVIWGYGLSALAKPLLALASSPWHVLAVRFVDRVGKGTRDAPRDALISLSSEQKSIGRAFGFHRGADTLGAAIGPLIAFFILPFIHNNLRTLFFLSFVASLCAVVIIKIFVRDVSGRVSRQESTASVAESLSSDMRPLSSLGVPFFIFLIASTIFSLGRASDAFLLLRAQNVGIALALLPIIYFVYNITYALTATPAGILSDKIGHRNTFMIGMLMFSATYMLFAHVDSAYMIWFLFVMFGFYGALTDGVGRAIVADLVEEKSRATAYGIYNACTGIALLPASFMFGLIWTYQGPSASFQYGAALGLIGFALFVFLRIRNHH
ncbi:MAG: MFS transporter [Candidatus Sungbacteria bacterium]|nr:MFS transporter [bacterium]MDZ4260383.1 MFS transporter [Candidatus Sungbacteria bacterium]